jgi:hypothetical protein
MEKTQMNGFNRTQKFVFSLCAIFLAAATFTPNAHALPGFKLGVAALGGMGLSSSETTSLLGTLSAKAGTVFGGGAAAEIGPLSAELLYVSRKATVSLAGVEMASASAASIDIPVMYQMGLGPLSLGMGGYYSMSMETGGGSTYGLVAGPRVSVPGGFFLDARGLYGLKKDDLGNNPIELQLLAGFSFL